MEFWHAIGEQDFLKNALISGILAAFACGMISPFVVVKRIGSAAGGIAHSILGGMGVCFYFGYDPIAGAVVSSFIAAALIALVGQVLKEYEDLVINALWATGMAIGLIFIAKTPGYAPDLGSYLFGNILLVGERQMMWVAVLTSIIFVTMLAGYRGFLLVAYDQEFARIRGLRVGLIEFLMLLLVALSVVVLMQIVGLILVIALLTMPAASTLWHSRSLLQMTLGATVIGVLSTISGLWGSYQFDLPSGPSIIMITAFIFGVIMIVRVLRGFKTTEEI